METKRLLVWLQFDCWQGPAGLDHNNNCFDYMTEIPKYIEQEPAKEYVVWWETCLRVIGDDNYDRTGALMKAVEHCAQNYHHNAYAVKEDT